MIAPRRESLRAARRLTLIKTWIVMVLVIFLGLDPGKARAEEITTECPLTKPGNPEVGFEYGEPLPEGTRAGGGGDRKYTEKDGVLYISYVYGTQPLYNSSLSCEYEDRSEIMVPIPGGLLRCGKVVRENKEFPNKSQFLRVWCVSRVP